MSPRVGLVLGAGGIVGHAFHAGVLAALEDVTGFDPRRAEVIVGTSAGSGVGALLRAGLSGRDLAARACGEPPSREGAALIAKLGPPPSPGEPPRFDLSRRRAPAAPGQLWQAWLRPWDARVGALAAAVLPEGRVATDAMSAPLERVFGGAWPSRRLWLCAVRLDDGRRIVFGDPAAARSRWLQGELGPRITVARAVQASSAVPGWFAPVVIDGVRYVDGGAWSPTNADLLAGEPLDALIVTSPMSAPPRLALGALDAAARLLHHSYLLRELARVRARRAGGSPRILAIEPTRADLEAMGPNPMDPKRRAPVTHAVREGAAARLRHGDLARRLEALKL
jgi:NTE family protein